ncbi:suppressor of cytokine signaling 1-like [Betta splendens]|uniref:Suppressor of cytokine signaling 1-like n=1 Tax=Betta splendens TaxID=158456 RepID=A0A6P7M416_BETSP|nr:suppressor of cytokine signaling 1-like [Betta splendens]XP_029001325.1 suppressor of cytokine signaling 1-like [Betta splendens]XP_029001331.1 suppressor of cytokine signaling 1-like [Betta splendens]
MCRMVRDNFKRTVVQNQKENHAAETPSQSQPSGEPAAEPAAEPSESVTAQSREPTERQLDLLHWHKLRFVAEPEAWNKPSSQAEADCLPTHLRPFSSQEEYKLVKTTYNQLLHSGFYWGPMTMEEAHEALAPTPLGTFLIRDSGQSDVFFTLSYQSDDGPTSVRVQLNNLLFGLHGSHRTFASLFALLTYYTGSSCKLRAPYRRQRPERLKEMCRRAFIRTFGAEPVGLSPQIEDYVHKYPHSI